MFKNKKSIQPRTLPKHPKHHHKPFRWRHLSLFLAGLLIGIASTYRSGYFVERPYDVNVVSPATVKIYHFVCGILVVDGQRHGGDVCDGGVGTGFLVSSDGYIATSGHVVTMDAADILVNELRQNPQLLQQYALTQGVTIQQITTTPEAASSLLADAYDLPKERLYLENRQEITFVALGDRPLSLGGQADIRKLFTTPDTDFIKQAKVIARDYSAKDLLVIEQKGQEGFSASDLALLKVGAQDAPFIKLADTSALNQNDPVSLIGFPSDAENQLTANNTITPSVTTGTISAIRVASGSDNLLFQTDADASQGNSGGPAINESGEAFGVVTYRFKDSNQANAPKSYIRDIKELKKLASANSVQLNTTSLAQQAWEAGLKHMFEDKYTQAIRDFRTAAGHYPAHRLAGTYIAQAQQAIREGKEVKDPPYALAAGFGITAVTLAVSIRLIVRHHRHHRRYRNAHQIKRHVITPGSV